MIFKKISRNYFILALSIICIFCRTTTFAQDADAPADGHTEDLVEFMEEGMKEIDFYSLEELLDIEVEVASLFAEDELVVGSTVSSVTSEQWKMMGAKRMHEALDNEMSVVTYPVMMGSYMFAIRGYAIAGSDRGIAMLVDGAPLTGINFGTSIYNIPNWELGTLNRIEMIKGPGSAIYGSDAFHGVISMKTFESDKDHYSVEGAGAYPLYGDAGAQISQGFFDNAVRIDLSAAYGYQGDQGLEFDYKDTEGFDFADIYVAPDEGTAEREFKYNNKTGVVKLRLKPLEKIKIKLGAYFNYGKYEKFPGVVELAFPFEDEGEITDQTLKTQGNDWSDSDQEFYMFNGSAEYTLFNNISVEVSGYHWDSARDFLAAATPSEIGAYGLQFGAAKESSTENEARDGAQIILKQPDNAINLQWLIAYSFTRMDIKNQEITLFIEGIPPSLMPEVPNLAEGYSRTINTVFTQIKWGAVKDRLYLLLGGRNDYYSDFGNQITPRGGIIFLPSKNQSIKALYGRAFRAPCAIEQEGREAIAMGDPDLEPEIIDIYELIYMYREKKWKASLNTFYSRWRNAITLEDYPENSDYLSRYVNKGKSESAGGELNIFYPVEPLTFDLGFSFVKSRALDVESASEPGKTTDRYYRAFPEYSVNAGIYYTFQPINTNFYLNNIVYLNMREAPEEVKSNPDKLPPYYRLDFNVSKIIASKLELYLNVRNALNRENRRPSVFGAEDGYVEPGTSVMLRAGYKF